MDASALALVPVIVLIVGVLATGRMLEMLFVSSALTAILMYHTGFLPGYVEMMYNTLANDTFQLILIILFGVGAMIEIFQTSGAMDSFAKAVTKLASTPKRAVLVTWLLGVILFFDDYMNTLCVTFSMRSVTDKHRVPREHLAYTASSMGASLCVLVPFTSWSAFAIATASDYGVDFSSYVQSIPFMFLPILAVLCALLVALGIIPKVGNVKKGYERVAAGGPVYFPGDKHAGTQSNAEATDLGTDVHPLNFFVPLLSLIVAMVLTGNSMECGIVVALTVQFILYMVQKIMTPREFLDTAIHGFRNFVDLAFTIFLAYMIVSTCLKMGMADFVIGLVGSNIPAWMIPALTFLVVGALGCTADSWVVTVLTVPIFLPMAIDAGIGVVIPMAAILSGVVLSTKVCLFADDVFMIAASTGVDNASQLKTVAPYILSCSAIAFLLYLCVGFVMYA